MLLFLFLSSIILHQSQQDEIPICKAVNYTGYLMIDKTNVTIYSYNLMITASANDGNNTFPNILTFTNHTYWSLNDTLYYATSPLYFLLTNPDGILRCPEMYKDCTVPYLNSGTQWLFFDFVYTWENNTVEQDWIVDEAHMLIYNGSFIGSDGQIMDPKTNSCTLFVGGESHGDLPYFMRSSACCTKYDYVTIPNSVDVTCQEFETLFNLTDYDRDIMAKFMARNQITSDGLAINAAVLESSKSINYYYGPYDPVFNCYGNGNNPNSTCVAENWFHDFQYEMSISYSDEDIYWRGNEGIIGEIIRKNGMFFKNGNQPYTPSDPCWYGITGIYGRNATISSSFCCTNFIPYLPETTAMPSKTTTFTKTPDIPTSRTSTTTQLPEDPTTESETTTPSVSNNPATTLLTSSSTTTPQSTSTSAASFVARKNLPLLLAIFQIFRWHFT